MGSGHLILDLMKLYPQNNINLIFNANLCRRGTVWKNLEMFCLNLDLFLGESLSSTSYFLLEEINCAAVEDTRLFWTEREKERERGKKREGARAHRSSPRDTERVTRPVETSGFWGDCAKTSCTDPRAFQGVLSNKEFPKPDITVSFMHHFCFSGSLHEEGTWWD